MPRKELSDLRLFFPVDTECFQVILENVGIRVCTSVFMTSVTNYYPIGLVERDVPTLIEHLLIAELNCLSNLHLWLLKVSLMVRKTQEYGIEGEKSIFGPKITGELQYQGGSQAFWHGRRKRHWALYSAIFNSRRAITSRPLHMRSVPRTAAADHRPMDPSTPVYDPHLCDQNLFLVLYHSIFVDQECLVLHPDGFHWT